MFCFTVCFLSSVVFHFILWFYHLVPRLSYRWTVGCFFFMFWVFGLKGCGIPWPGIDPAPFHWKMKSFSHWTIREVPWIALFLKKKKSFLLWSWTQLNNWACMHCAKTQGICSVSLVVLPRHYSSNICVQLCAFLFFKEKITVCVCVCVCVYVWRGEQRQNKIQNCINMIMSFV